MKKKIIIITMLLLLILFVFGIFFKYVDTARVRTGHEPKLTIKLISKNGNKVTYWGLGYKVIRYPSVSPDEPYKNNRGVKMGTWFMNYKIPNENTKYVIKEIKDLTKNMLIFSCAEAIDKFYEDENYEYYYDCLKSKYIIVIYEDNSEEIVKDALKKGHIKISDLDRYQIDYIKYEKKKER